MPKVVSFLSIAEDMLLIKSIKANAVKWLLRNLNCFEYKILCKFKKLISRLYMTFSKSLEKAGRIDIGLWLLKSIGSSALKTGITLAILRDSGNTPVDNKVFIMVTRGCAIFWKDWWIIFMDILSCPRALLALNDLTLFNSPTVSCCNEMDSERELLKKSLGDEFV